MLEHAKTLRPAIPAFDPSRDSSVDDWKMKSGMQQGFDLCLQIFTPK